MVSDGFFNGVQLSIAHRRCSQEVGPLTDQAVCEGPISSLRLESFLISLTHPETCPSMK